jgi:hypothetical protein
VTRQQTYCIGVDTVITLVTVDFDLLNQFLVWNKKGLILTIILKGFRKAA